MTKPNELDQINPFAKMEQEEQYVEVFSETFTISAEDVKKMKDDPRSKPKINPDGDVEPVPHCEGAAWDAIDFALAIDVAPSADDIIKALHDAGYVIVRQNPTEE